MIRGGREYSSPGTDFRLPRQRLEFPIVVNRRCGDEFEAIRVDNRRDRGGLQLGMDGAERRGRSGRPREGGGCHESLVDPEIRSVAHLVSEGAVRG
jgi:hypothetical protein